MTNKTFRRKAIAAALLMVSGQGVMAAEAGPKRSAAQELIIEEVMVYGTKRSTSRAVQEVPAQVSAFGTPQLEARQVVTLEDLSFSIPNVNLDGIGTIKGVANFSIRGFNLNSSIPSLDPAVGVFIDGVYSGSTYATIMDTFDLENIEIYRGPQGVLFGRNVTGGAVLMRSARPSTQDHAAHFKAKLGYETEDQLTTAVSLSGPLSEGILAGKLTLYRTDDGGFYHNDTVGRDVGESETTFARGVLVYTPTDTLEITAIYEQGKTEGDGPVPQAPMGASPLNPSSDQVTNANTVGFDDQEWARFTLEANWDIGGGRLTNIFGWRDIDVANDLDTDTSPISNFNSNLAVEQSQLSNELRYNIEPTEGWNLTVGAYYFEQDVLARNGRLIRLPTSARIADPYDILGLGSQVRLSGAGELEHSTWAVFVNNDVEITDAVTLTAGIRYSKETKDNILVYPLGTCDPDTLVCSGTQAPLDFTWSNVSPKLGVQWHVDEDVQLYAHWTRGFRSGGVNLRSTFANPPPFDEETQDSFEVGIKSTFADGRVRLNGALFHNKVKDLQRTTTVTQDGQVTQDTDNAADATIEGAEIELSWLVTDNFGINLGVGYIDAEYDKIISDLNRDDVIDAKDLALEFPRVPEYAYNIEATYDHDLGPGAVSGRVGYSYRDQTFSDDRNSAIMPDYEMVNAGLTYKPHEGNWTITLYGKNLTDETVFNFVGGLGSSFAPGNSALYYAALGKGRRYGVELSYSF